MGIPKRSFLLSLSLTFLVGYAVSNMAHFFLANIRFYEEFDRERNIALLNQAKFVGLLLKHNEEQELIARLKEAKELRQIDFFQLKRQGRLLAQDGMSENQALFDLKPGQMI